MNVTQFLAEIGDVLDDPDGKKYPFDTRIRHGDRQIRGLYRTMVQSNKQWSNFTMVLQAEDALEPLENVFDYALPSWVIAVAEVWIRTGTAAVETSYSPYRWSSGSAQRGTQIPKSVANPRQPHWSWEGQRTLRLWGYTQAQELVLQVVARPARMFKGVIATAHVDTDKFYLPTPSYGVVELDEGAYINSEWQITDTFTSTSRLLGEIRRCIYSSASTIDSGVRYHTIYLDKTLGAIIAAKDTVETLLPLPDEHARVLILKTAQACMQAKGNIRGLEAIAGEMREESQKFLTYAVTPRDSRGPTEWQRPNKVHGYRLTNGRVIAG